MIAGEGWVLMDWRVNQEQHPFNKNQLNTARGVFRGRGTLGKVPPPQDWNIGYVCIEDSSKTTSNGGLLIESVRLRWLMFYKDSLLLNPLMHVRFYRPKTLGHPQQKVEKSQAFSGMGCL